MSLVFLIAVACLAAGGEAVSDLMFAEGRDATLPCGDVIGGLALWSFQNGRRLIPILTENGKCSLVLRKVAAKDAGLYECHTCKTPLAFNVLVVTLTQVDEEGGLWLSCSVSSVGRCRHVVQWRSPKGAIRWEIMESCSARALVRASGLQTDGSVQCVVTSRTGSDINIFDLPSEGQKDPMEGKNSAYFPVVTNWLRVTVAAAGFVAFTACLVYYIMRARKKGNQKQADDDDANALYINSIALHQLNQ